MQPGPSGSQGTAQPQELKLREESASCPVCGAAPGEDCRCGHRAGPRGWRWGGGPWGAPRWGHDHRESRFSIGLGPRFFALNRTGYQNAFTNNGFTAPSQDRFGFDLLLAWELPARWSVGFGVAAFATRAQEGAGDATYTQGNAGLFVARELLSVGRFDLSLGTLVGSGMAEVEVFSGAADGRLRETSFFAEPLLRASFGISRHLRLGASVSYLFPFASSTEARGDALGTGEISAQGATAGVQLIFGNFGHASRTETYRDSRGGEGLQGLEQKPASSGSAPQ
jgi:hypothetical protein